MRLVCYCFIRQQVAAGRCACELWNPEGRCCLGNVRALLDGCVEARLRL